MGANYGQRLLNQEGCMARHGLDPTSRKVRTPGRNRRGYVVYLSYQLVDNISVSQIMMETVLYGVDIEKKKKQLLHQLGDLKMSPPVDDKVRKTIRDVKEFMMKEQVDVVHQVKELRDVNKLSVVLQFIQLIQAGGEGQGGLGGLNQFVSFLSTSDNLKRSSSRQSVIGSNNVGSMQLNKSARSRKQSSSSMSSSSTAPESPRSSNRSCRVIQSTNNCPVREKVTSSSRRLSNLADIPSDQEDVPSSKVSTLKPVKKKSGSTTAPKKLSSSEVRR